MAFIHSSGVVRISPTCLARRNSPRRSNRARSSKQSRPARLDPILNDGDIDSTDITTYISCPVCFNSLMLRPEKLVNGPVPVRCNCCEKSTTVSLEQLENTDGSIFDLNEWIGADHGESVKGDSDVEGEVVAVEE